jgi:heat shock protein HtpX
VYKQITSNKRKSLVLMAGFLLLYALVGWLLSLYFGQWVFAVVVVVAIVMIVVNLFMGDDLVTSVSRARRVERKEEAPALWRLVENLAITAGLPMPRLYIVTDEAPNAFAAGRNPEQAVVAVTTGLLERLDEEELEGVLAHEMSHIRNYDIRLMTYAAVLAGSIALLSQIFLRGLWFGGGRDRDSGGPLALVAVLAAVVLAPIAAVIIQTAISRKREYVADAAGAELTRFPAGLASALRTIEASMKPSQVLANPAIAHMMIAPPLRPGERALRVFATHPPTEDRVARLDEMAGGQQHQHEKLTEGFAVPPPVVDADEPEGPGEDETPFAAGGL